VQQPVGADDRTVDLEVARHRRVQAELLLVSRDADLVGVEDERTHAAGAGRLEVGAREDEEGAGVAAVRDPLFRAGDPPALAVGLCTGAKRPRVRAGLRLGQGEGAEMLAARERRDEARALLVRAEREQREGDCACVHRDGDADAGIRAGQLFEREDVRDEVGAGPAVLLGDARAHEPELCELREDLAREGVVAVPFGGVRLDLLSREVARERLDLLLVGGRLEIHAATILRAGVRAPGA